MAIELQGVRDRSSQVVTLQTSESKKEISLTAKAAKPVVEQVFNKVCIGLNCKAFGRLCFGAEFISKGGIVLDGDKKPITEKLCAIPDQVITVTGGGITPKT